MLRKILRSAPLRCLARLLPSRLAWRIAANASRQSKRSRNEKNRRWPAREILLSYARDLHSRGHQTIITGHFHQPLHETMDGIEVVALGDWINQFSYAVYEDGLFELKTYDPAADS
jgi:UDP-2,3-diacylglucosamine hydrolase